ncbi:MAG: hypothetical protein ACJ763_02570 [Bdellovibrionia bacterium]
MKSSVVILGCLLLSSLAHAGKESSGGGNASCAEFADIAGMIVGGLKSLGQAKVSAINPKVKITDLNNVYERLRCIPVNTLDRQARSYPREGRTDLLVKEWRRLSDEKKQRLVAHELAVLARYEVDGQYNISDDITYLADAQSDAIFELPRCTEIDQKSFAVGSKCITADSVEHIGQSIFESVKIDETHAGWKDPKGNIWTESLGLTDSATQAKELCQAIGGSLPTGKDYYSAEHVLLSQVLPDLKGEKAFTWTSDDDAQYNIQYVFFSSSLFGARLARAEHGSKYSVHCLIQDNGINDALKAKTLAMVSKSQTLSYVMSNSLAEPKPTISIAVSSLDLNSIRCDHGNDGESAYSYCVIPVQRSSACALKMKAVEFDYDSQGSFKFVVQPETNCIRF